MEGTDMCDEYPSTIWLHHGVIWVIPPQIKTKDAFLFQVNYLHMQIILAGVTLHWVIDAFAKFNSSALAAVVKYDFQNHFKDSYFADFLLCYPHVKAGHKTSSVII